VKDYHRHWRKKFDEVIFPADLKAQGTLRGVPEGDGFLRWHGLGLMTAAIQDYYSDQDFDVTDAILARARQCELTGVQQRLVDRLIPANQHNRFTFETMRAVAIADSVAALEKASQLVDFRID
jgi:hypothetical protein